MTGSSLTKPVFRILIGAAPFLLSLSASAQTYRSPQLKQSELIKAYQKIVHAQVFNLGGVGFGQQITPEEKAFKKILESSEAVTTFPLLLKEANGEGQLYALFGLHLRAPDIFRNEAERLRNEGPPERTKGLAPVAKGKVRVARGCIFFQADYKAVVDEITKGIWDFAFHSSTRISIS